MKHETALILDFGSQYTKLIARRIRQRNIYSEIVPFNISYEEVLKKDPKVIILSGGPSSVLAEKAPIPDKRILEMELPILGICYGMQLLTHLLGGKVAKVKKREFGFAQIKILDDSNILKNLAKSEDVWMSHGDAVLKLPENFVKIAESENSPYAAIAHKEKPIYAFQFHPEVQNTVNGMQMLDNFLLEIAGFSSDWTTGSFIEETIESVRKKVGTDNVILGMSGGVDSSVVAAILYKAIGDQLKPILVDTGVMRKNEIEEVEAVFNKEFGMKLNVVRAGDLFLDKLKDIEDPEKKRKIIGSLFIEIFEKEAEKYDNLKYLAQGTLYPDVIESVSFSGPSVTIKSHHNVGGLPDKMNLKLIEPLRETFKDEVRSIGKELGLPEIMVGRHPFPGPGLAIRIIGTVTPERVEILQEIDAIFIEELRKNNLYDKTWQAFAVLLPIKSVGVMGDERTYENVCALRAVSSTDGMTADWTELPYKFLKKVSNRIINEISGVNRVVYDISSKPPATIEWE